MTETITVVKYNQFLLVGLLSFILSFFLTPLFRIISIKFKIVDNPDEDRKLHDSPKAILGGLAVAFSFLITYLYLYYFYDMSNFISQKQNTGILLGSILIVLIGLFDDIYKISAYLKLFLQLLPAIILFNYGFTINVITNPLTGSELELTKAISFILTIAWVLILTNAINLIDGLDGLATGVSIIGTLTLFIIALNRGKLDVISAFLTIILLGSLSGFIKYNFPPASIFLGDTGSLFIGFILSSIGILGINKSSTAVALMVPLAAVGIPIYDTLYAILRRTRQGKHIFQADSEHIHHRLLRMGFSVRQSLMLLYGVSIYFGIVSYALLKMPDQFNIYLLFFFFLSIFFIAAYMRKKEIKVYIRKKSKQINEKK